MHWSSRPEKFRGTPPGRQKCSATHPAFLVTLLLFTSALLWYFDVLYHRPPSAPSQPEACAFACVPPLGWNSRYTLAQATRGPESTGAMINATANALRILGLAAAGYRTVVIDDTWQAWDERSGGYRADPAQYPQGMGAVAEHLRRLNLTLGLSTGSGNYSCKDLHDGFGPSRHEHDDVAQWVKHWGVGYVKSWGCNGMAKGVRRVIDTQPAPITLECGNYLEAPWHQAPAGKRVCNVWAVADDVADTFEGWTAAVDRLVEAGLNRHAGAAPGTHSGGWSLIDYLQVGGSQSLDEYRAQLSMYAVLPAPLFIGTDVRGLAPETLEMYLHEELLYLNQDAAGRPGTRYYQDRLMGVEVWVRPLATFYGYLKAAFLLLNRSSATKQFTLNFQAIGHNVRGMESWNVTVPASDDTSSQDAAPATREVLMVLEVELRDVWAKKNLGSFKGEFSTTVPPRSSMLLTGLTPQRTPPTSKITT